jgi:LysM repeat protein
MIRNPASLCIAMVIGLFTPVANAQDAAQEIRELRALIERQSKQIDELTKWVQRLAQSADEGQSKPSGDFQVPEQPRAAAGAISDEEVLRPEAVGRRHIVVKGETLTSIAKHYNMPLSELMKANKDVNERKLQIGQQLIIPQTPDAAKPTATPDTKENQ